MEEHRDKKPKLQILTVSDALKPDDSGEQHYKPGTHGERQTIKGHGGYTHGVTVFAGGPPHDIPLKPEIPPGTVLATSSTLKPDLSMELDIKEGTVDERLGHRGGFTNSPTKNREHLWETDQNHGTVLQTFDDLKADHSYEEAIECLKSGTDERESHGHGGYTHGRAILKGGPARDIPLKLDIDPGEVLSTSSTLKPDLRFEIGMKPGTDERLGHRGGFTPSPTKCMEKFWEEDAHKHGMVLGTFDSLKPDHTYDEAIESLKQGTDERESHTHGGFTHWVPIFKGGPPHEDLPMDTDTDASVFEDKSSVVPGSSDAPKS